MANVTLLTAQSALIINIINIFYHHCCNALSEERQHVMGLFVCLFVSSLAYTVFKISCSNLWVWVKISKNHNKMLDLEGHQ